MGESAIKELGDEVSKLEIGQDELDGIRLGKNRCVQKFGDVYVVEHMDGEYGIIDKYGHVIVPFGKYGWIDGFSFGLARVRTKGHSGRVGNIIASVDLDGPLDIWEQAKNKRHIEEDRKKHPEEYAKWGIINKKGEEVLPLEYDDVWSFYGKDIDFTTIEKDGEQSVVLFSELNPSLRSRREKYYTPHRDYNENDYGISQYYDYEGFLDEEKIEDAYYDGEWVPDDI